MKPKILSIALAHIVVALALAAITAICVRIHANATTASMAYVVLVLLTSLVSGLAPGIFASVAATLCLNYFFLPPVGAFTIDRTEDWIALTAFLVSAGLVSQLSSAARKRAVEAEHARDELAGLYRLSQSMMAPSLDSESIARNVAEAFGTQYCSFHVSSGEKLEMLVGEHERGVRYIQVRAGEKLLGVLTVKPDNLPESTLNAIAGMLALALNRTAHEL